MNYEELLEKQGKQARVELSQSKVTKTSDQELSDKIEPKFKVGDWVTKGWCNRTIQKKILSYDTTR